MHWYPQRNLHGFHQTILDEQAMQLTPDFRSDYLGWFHSVAPNLDFAATGLDWNGYEARPYALPEHLHPTSWTGQTAVNFIETYNRTEPFFLKVSFVRPHSPYDPIGRFWKKYENANLPGAAVGSWAAKYAPRSDNGRSIWHGDLGAGAVRTARQGYYGSISQVDEQLGRIFEALEKRGWYEETLILCTADHGDMTGDHHLWRKSYAYEASARIPMLLRWPEGLIPASRGRVLEGPVELRDVLPTLADAAGAAIPDEVEGRSLLDLAQGRTGSWRPWIDLEHDVGYDPSNHWNALTDGRTKYIFHARDASEQLFDLTGDPHETRDLAGEAEHAGLLRQWRQRLIEHLSVRGEAWVKNGTLRARPERQLYSPNYPAKA